MNIVAAAIAPACAHADAIADASANANADANASARAAAIADANRLYHYANYFTCISLHGVHMVGAGNEP